VEQADTFLGLILDNPTEGALAAALVEVPEGPASLLAVLHDRFVHAGEGFGSLENDPLFWRVVAIATTTWSGAERDTFAKTTMFHAAAPDAYRWMAPLVRVLFRPLDAERLILAAVERGDARARVCASHLAYHLFDGTIDYAMSEIGARRLKLADPLRADD
jgi:hypothetical protein